ncbi:MAG: hypothetical protein AABY85_08820 [Gemmatimonadota bacterium]|jgi:hypothetical protein
MTNPPPQQPSAREQMRDAVANVMQDVAEKKHALKEETQVEQERRRRRQQRSWLLATLAGLALVISFAMNLPRWQHPFQPPAGAAAERDARRAILFAAALVDRYTAATGNPPTTLAQAGATLPGVVYRPMSGGYELSVMVEGKPIVFHGGDDPDRFRHPTR